jgi:uncharacterized protein UPF0164
MRTSRMMSPVCAIALTALAAGPLAAQALQQDNTAYGGAAAEFLLLGAGARGTALGGAFSALATDVTALYYNPGGLAQLTRPTAAVSTYQYVADTRYTWLGMAFPVSGGTRAVGMSLGSFGFSDQPVYTVDDPEGLSGRTYSVNETFMAATLAQNFSDRFSAGVSVKYIRDRLGSAAASGFALDFGTNFHAAVGERPIRASFVIQNLGSNLRHDGEDLTVGVTRDPPLGTVDVPQEPQSARLRSTAWTMPVQFRVGVALDAFSQGTNRVTVLAEFTQPSNTKPGAGAGVEWASANVGGSGVWVAARGSYALNPDNEVSDIDFGRLTSDQSTGTFTRDGLAVGGGIGYEKRNLRFGVDYAWRSLGLLGGTNFFTVTLGW